jgi:hypothetical protein
MFSKNKSDTKISVNNLRALKNKAIERQKVRDKSLMDRSLKNSFVGSRAGGVKQAYLKRKGIKQNSFLKTRTVLRNRTKGKPLTKYNSPSSKKKKRVTSLTKNHSFASSMQKVAGNMRKLKDQEKSRTYSKFIKAMVTPNQLNRKKFTKIKIQKQSEKTIRTNQNNTSLAIGPETNVRTEKS